MKFIDKLERKFGNRGIENLTIYIIVSYVLGYALMYINPGALSMLSLNVSEILHGQIWRLVTWIIYPPSTSSALWFMIAILFFYYPISASLERTWGSFRFTVYILSGMIFTSNFCVYFVFYHRWSVRCLSEWITVFNVLYQFIYFSGICADISGYEGFTVLCNPDQDEVDGDCICCSCGI